MGVLALRTMGNGRTTNHSVPIRNLKDLRADPVNGPVFRYQLPEEELEQYRALKPPPKKDSAFIVWNAK